MEKEIGFKYDYLQTVKELGGFMVANANQGRLEKKWFANLIDKDVIIISSGSRFYRGPPHSGAVFIPPPIMDRLKAISSDEMSQRWDQGLLPQGLNSFFGKNEFPRQLSTWRDQMEDNQNPGLALRWVAALAEMEPTLQIPYDDWWPAKVCWRSEVIHVLDDQPILVFNHENADTESIISINVKNKFNGKLMTADELKLIYQAMTMDLSGRFDWSKVDACNSLSADGKEDKEMKV